VIANFSVEDFFAIAAGHGTRVANFLIVRCFILLAPVKRVGVLS
jgi:hypothetical protein